MNDQPAKIPKRLDQLLGFSMSCGCGRIHSVDTRGASVRKGAVEDVVSWAREVGRKLSVCVVADRVTRSLMGEKVKALLSKYGHRVRLYELADGAGGRPHADEQTLLAVERALSGNDLAVAVGSGTVCDLVKLGSYRKGIPYLAVATAPSMNGYTSAIAAVLIQGVKRTLDCHQPFAVIADLDVIQNAPEELIMSGLGDLESKPTACADFRLASAIRGDYHCSVPEQVVVHAEARVAESAAGLGSRDPQAVAWLMEALLLSGISMKLASSSSPASGGEHLISHFWDMTAKDEHRVEGWHGAQVGVATIVTATLYDHLRSLSPDEIEVEKLVTDWPTRREFKKSIREMHGVRAEEVSKQYFAKSLSKIELSRELRKVRDNWQVIWNRLDDVLRPASRIRSVLASAGAPTSMSELGLDVGHLRRALLAAHHIRARFTVLDFASELGYLAPLAEKVLIESVCPSK